MEEIEEGMAQQAEVEESLSRPIGDPVDEDELEADLADLMGEDVKTGTTQRSQGVLGGAAADALPEAPTGDVLPAAPTGELNAKEEEALKELQAELGM